MQHLPDSKNKAIARAETGERVSERPASARGVAPWYNAKYSATQEIRGFQPIYWTTPDKETGEVFPLVQEDTNLKKRFDPRETRLERFALQSAVRRLLWGSRTAKCLRLRQARRKGEESAIEVWRSSEHGSTHYAGLQTCGSVWACPVCAAKVSERRRLDLLDLMEQHKAEGGDVLLLTLTNPHTAANDLTILLKAQAKAMSALNGNRSAKALWEDIGCVGTVRALEVTHGHANGWHPHFHILIFVPKGLDLLRLRRRFYVEWAKACRLAKLPIPAYRVRYVQDGKKRYFYGVDVQDGKKAGAYVTKGLWGLDHEMTKSHIKKASRGRRSPFDLLRSFLYDDDKQAAALFKEYAAAFKGKRQLQYSNGLKELYQVEDLSDEELAAIHEDSAELLGKIELEDWRLILSADLRGEVLELGRHGWDPIERLLDSLREQEKKRKREKEKKIKGEL